MAGSEEKREAVTAGGDRPAAPTAVGTSGLDSPGVVLWAYTLTSFFSALLLFSVQPMFAKMVLPQLGGSPSVWAVAMFFFQTALLVGYCWAHLLIARAALGLTGPGHLAIYLLALLALPIGLPAAWTEPPPGEPYLWQLGLFTVAIGLPFVAVAANAPLLQAWFARTGHPHARDPYFLYAASNLGSLIALLGYPFVLEPAFGLKTQSRLWTGGFVVLTAAMALVFWMAHRGATRAGAGAPVRSSASASAAASDGAGPAPTWRQRLVWIGLALVPSALLTAYTTHLTTDIASAPLLWVLPLSLYLLTFVLVFRDTPLVPDKVMLPVHLVAVLVALVALSQTTSDSWFVTAATGMVAFFTAAMIAHRTLYDARPAAAHLTDFYISMSLGGALGGLAAALLAPRIFGEVFEYPLLLALTMACRPGVFDWGAVKRVAASLGIGSAAAAPAPGHVVAADRRNALVIAGLVLGGLLAIFLVSRGFRFLLPDNAHWAMIIAAVFAVLVLLDGRILGQPPSAASDAGPTASPARQFASAMMICAAVVLLPSAVRQGNAERSYFGVYRVQDEQGEYRTLHHGTTLHGAQRVRDDDGNPVDDTTPSTYYYPGGPMAKAIARKQAGLGEAKGRYGIVGLGTGALACFKKPGEAWRFYEIDPVVVRIAKDPRHFTYLAKCQPDTDIVLGDARLTIAREQPAGFDLLVVDAFSSDAVPVHLLTAEAIRLYLDKLKPDGLLVLHISNRYLALDNVVGATMATLAGVAGLLIEDDSTTDRDEKAADSTVAVLSRSAVSIAALRDLEGTSDLPTDGVRAWTDDYSDILGAFVAKLRN